MGNSRKTPTPRNTLSGKASQTAAVPRKVRLSDIPLVKGMLIRGDLQSDLAAYFGTNNGRISEVNTGKRGPDIPAAHPRDLPEPGPHLSGRTAHEAKAMLLTTRVVLLGLLAQIDQSLAQIDQWENRKEDE